MGNTINECAAELSEAGAHAIGANCGEIDPYQMAEIVSEMKKTTQLPVFIQPNAGKPEFIDGKIMFKMPPDKFLEDIKVCIEAGVHMIGGCCGTSPEHIHAVSEYISTA